MTSTKFSFFAIAVALILTLGINLLRPWVVDVNLVADTGVAWYYWQQTNPSWLTQVTAWLGYAAHQVFFWGLIYWAQKQRYQFVDKVRSINWIALWGTVAFVILHWVQTALWYDGLAQDVSIFSSQGSVILLLVLVLIMENKRRGLFFGTKAKGLDTAGSWLRHYHGYIFSWATIYTFWYHPMENTSGHLIGFLYTMLLMIQGALLFTRMHTNKYWTLALEVTVLFHGTLVAVLQGTGIWPMFFFGFGGIFIITQMHGLGLKKLTRWLWATAYLITVFWVYQSRGWENLNEILRIPMIDYLLVFVLGGLLWLWVKWRHRGSQNPRV